METIKEASNAKFVRISGIFKKANNRGSAFDKILLLLEVGNV